MTGSIRQKGGVTTYYLDAVPVTQEMYDAYFPSKIFPSESAYTREEIEEFVRLADESEIDPEMQKRLPRGYPIRSVALSTTSKGAKRAMEDAARRGVPTEFTKDGTCILRDAAHRRAYLRAYGYHDRNSYNGY